MNETTLYRYFGEGGQLLYVGITDNPRVREMSHQEKFWWQYVHYKTTQGYDDRRAAEIAERAAIDSEKPMFNRHPGARSRRSPAPIAAYGGRDSEGSKRGYLTLTQAAEQMGVSVKTVRRRISEGSLIGYRMGPRVIRVKTEDVDSLLHPIPTAATA